MNKTITMSYEDHEKLISENKDLIEKMSKIESNAPSIMLKQTYGYIEHVFLPDTTHNDLIDQAMGGLWNNMCDAQDNKNKFELQVKELINEKEKLIEHNEVLKSYIKINEQKLIEQDHAIAQGENKRKLPWIAITSSFIVYTILLVNLLINLK